MVQFGALAVFVPLLCDCWLAHGVPPTHERYPPASVPPATVKAPVWEHTLLDYPRAGLPHAANLGGRFAPAAAAHERAANSKARR